MSGLNLTRERVTKVGKISEASLREDWLALYDLLKNYVDEFPVRNSEIVWCVYASQMRDKIRALIGDE